MEALSILLVTKKVKLLKVNFENDGKNMSFLIKDDKVWEKYDEIWDVILKKTKH